MTLDSGKRLGPYEIMAPLGAGGMGEVYRARDTRLDRIVALKVLATHLASSPEQRQRFEREAKAISALSHPHICVLYDVGHHGGIDFLVMEYLEGESLAGRLKKGAFALDQVFRHGVEIADALAKAHRHGIVHRDLKPGNVMLTKSGAKLLDFGLAKLRPTGAQPLTNSELTALPTEDKPLTAAGSIVGTLQYMAPEQLEGKEPDARTDIFALGAVLHEMATGKPAFTGKSQASLIAAILSSQPPPISSLQPLTPAALDRVVTACLAKDPDERWQNAHDLAGELRWIAEAGSHAGMPGPVGAVRRGGARLLWTAAAVAATALGVALGFAVASRGEKQGKQFQVHFQVAPPENSTFSGWAVAVSPDGEHIAYSASAEGSSYLYVRTLKSLNATRVPDTEGAASPFWSPDGRQLGFVARGRLKKVDLSGGPAQTLYDVRELFSGASWSPAGIIVFSVFGELFQVTTGGEAKPLGKRAEGETGRFWPHFLPDGRRYLYFQQAVSPESQGIYVASLDSGDRKRIVASDNSAAYSLSGYLLFMRGGVLMAQRFDETSLAPSGDAFPVVEQVAPYQGGYVLGAAYSVSPNGVLAWRTGSGFGSLQLTWFDRSGKKLGTLGEPADYSNPSLSPDERSLAIGRADLQSKTRDVWIFDLARETSRRLTFDPADDFGPIWSPDGKRIVFGSDRRGRREIYQKLADGSGGDELLLESKGWPAHMEDWSPDGKLLVYNQWPTGKPPDLYFLPMSPGDRKPIPFLVTEFGENQGQFSPNGKWIAYTSNDSGPIQVYVRGVSLDGAAASGKWQVSTAGGQQASWRRDGKELFYVSGSTFMAVEVKTDGAAFEAGVPKPLFEARLAPEARRSRYVVTRDGQRFLVIIATAMEQPQEPIHVLVNWLPSKR